MIPYNTIKTSDTNDFYDMFYISDDDIEQLKIITDLNDGQDALDTFIEDYIKPASEKYKAIIMEYLNEIYVGPMQWKDTNNLTRNISLLTLGLSTFLIHQFNKYTKTVYAPGMFKNNGITDSELQRNVIREITSEFEKLIGSTLSQTQGFLVNGIRTLQREMIAENLLLKKSGISGTALEKEIIKFKESLKNKYPEMYEAAKHGKLLTTAKFIDGREVVRRYELNYYLDLTTRTTLLNADRISNVVAALIDDEDVVEYYLSDPRSVVKDREICQHILNTKVNGLSILALNEEAAKRYGIMSVDEAQATPDYAMGPYCRHSLRRCSQEYLKELHNASD